MTRGSNQRELKLFLLKRFQEYKEKMEENDVSFDPDVIESFLSRLDDFFEYLSNEELELFANGLIS